MSALDRPLQATTEGGLLDQAAHDCAHDDPQQNRENRRAHGTVPAAAAAASASTARTKTGRRSQIFPIDVILFLFRSDR
jgi:hypothetical protein